MYIVRYRDTPRAINTIPILFPRRSICLASSHYEHNHSDTHWNLHSTIALVYSQPGVPSLNNEAQNANSLERATFAEQLLLQMYIHTRQQYRDCVDGSGSVPIPHNVHVWKIICHPYLVFLYHPYITSFLKIT